MSDERKPIGYLMGKPIYASDSTPQALDPEQYMAMAFGELTPEIAKKVVTVIVADRLAEQMVNESPRGAM